MPKKIVVTTNLDDSGNVCGTHIAVEEPEEPPPPPILVPHTISIVPNVLSAEIGAVAQDIIALVRDQLGGLMDNETVSFSSSNPAIASITQITGRTATIQFLAVGIVVITATASNGITGSAFVSVIDPAPAPPVPTKIVISPASPQVVEPNTLQFSAVVYDQYDDIMPGRAINWSSSDPTKATIDGAGLATGVAAGSTIIKAEDALAPAIFKEEALIVIASTPTPTPSRVILTPASSTKELGTGDVSVVGGVYDQFDMLMPGEDLVFTTINASIATVSEPTPNNAVIRPLAVGTTQIKATVLSNGVAAFHDITVTPIVLIPTTVVVLPASASKDVGQTQQYTAEVRDQFGNTMAGVVVSWSSSNISRATVNAVTGLATAVSPGTCQIIATAPNGANGSGNLTVTSPAPPTPIPSTIVITPASSTKQVGTGPVAIVAACYDQFGTLMPAEELVFVSLQPSIATVVEGSPNHADISPVSAGTAAIRVSATNGIFKDHIITVTAAPAPPVASTVTVAPASATGVVGAAGQQFVATVKDQYGNTMAGETVSWSSSIPSVASVSATGFATPLAAGTTSIIATVNSNTTVKGSAVYTVTNPAPPPPQGGIGALPVSPNPTHEPVGMTLFTDRDMTQLATVQNDPVITGLNWDSNVEWTQAVNVLRNGYRVCELVPQPGNEPQGNSTVVRQFYYPGMMGGSSPARMYTKSMQSRGHTEIYILDILAIDDDWQANQSNVNKSAFTKWAGSDPGNFYWMYYGGNKDFMNFRIVLQGNWNNTAANPRTGLKDSVFPANCVNGTPLPDKQFTGARIPLNRWMKIEIRARMNDGYNGILQVWMDDLKILDYDCVNFIAPGASGSFFSTYSRDGTWGGGFGPILAPGFYLWWSRCRISTKA